MTSDEIEKEAERKLAALADDVTMQMVDPKSQGWQEAYGYVLDALRAVHNAAIEEAGTIADTWKWGGAMAKQIRARAAECGRQCDQYHCGHDSCNAARAAELLTDTKPDGD